jgi:hypothetical protein
MQYVESAVLLRNKLFNNNNNNNILLQICKLR